MNIKIGNGYDVHKLVVNRNLILGGVKIQNKFGLLGFSDADVLIHSIIDALCGAMNIGDIGILFPSNNIKYKNISSMILLKKVYLLLLKNKFKISNIDSIIIMQEPKISHLIHEMKNNISNILNIDKQQISIKATTEDYLGFTGSKLGIAAHSVCLIYN